MTATAADPADISYTVDEVVAELDPLGRALWDGARARAENRKLRTELARHLNSDSSATTAPVVPPAGEPTDG